MSGDQVDIPLLALHQLKPGQIADVYALLEEKEKAITRDGKPYYTCRFRDRHRSASCMVWANSQWFAPCDQEWQEGRCYRLRVMYDEHERFGPQLELFLIRPVQDRDYKEGFDPSILFEASRHDPDKMYRELMDLAEHAIGHAGLKRLVVELLHTYADKLRSMPASAREFYPFYGGWLEHVLSVARLCSLVVQYYRDFYADARPPLNADLVLAAAMLHELGRVEELTTDGSSTQVTVPGRLFGRCLLAYKLVHDAGQKIPELDAETLQLLEHIILSHLELPEWGSPRLPLIPECLILHHLDDLDAKMEMYQRCLRKDTSPGPFTYRDPVLGKPLLKARNL